MPRLARLIIPGYPYHIIQRGNRRQSVFYDANDKLIYLDLLNRYAKPAGIDFWAYCLMDNHVHLIVIPKNKKSLAIGLGKVHIRYTRMINFRQGWRGHLWEDRFKSYLLSERHLYAAIRYVERNPVRAKIVRQAQDYPWSSARVHVKKDKSPLLTPMFLNNEIKDWALYLQQNQDTDNLRLFKNILAPADPI